MKKVLKLSICMLVMISSIATSYANDYSVRINEKGKKEITLTLDHVKVGQQLYIKEVDGLTLYTEAFKTSGIYNNKFDLSNLPNGNYYFEHEKDYQIKIMPFKVVSGEVVFNRDKELTVFKPVFKVKNNNIYLSKLALNKEDLNVKIYYDSNYGKSDFELIHSETITDEINIERIYSLSDKEKGDYRIDIEANGRSYSEFVSI